MMKNNRVNPANPFIGNRVDEQIPGAYSKYADWVMETLLQYMRPIMKAKTGLELIPTYSYTRLYEKGNILHRHKDRSSCEISTTLHLGGDEWPIFLNPDPERGNVYGPKEGKYKVQSYRPTNDKGTRIDLKVGDMLIYSGCELEHWREPFQGTVCSQVFLHYNHANGPFAKTNLLDGRSLLGVPK